MNPATQQLFNAVAAIKQAIADFLVRVGNGVTATDATTLANDLNAQVAALNLIEPPVA